MSGNQSAAPNKTITMKEKLNLYHLNDCVLAWWINWGTSWHLQTLLVCRLLCRWSTLVYLMYLFIFVFFSLQADHVPAVWRCEACWWRSIDRRDWHLVVVVCLCTYLDSTNGAFRADKASPLRQRPMSLVDLNMISLTVDGPFTFRPRTVRVPLIRTGVHAEPY